MKTVCTECGKDLGDGRKAWVSFCGASCRTTFNNRRKQRGAEMYDLFMAMRYQRGVAKLLGVWALICAAAHHYRELDRQERGGRPSWQEPDIVVARMAWLKAKRV